MPVIGYAPGAYDLFHIGHLNILKHAAEHCDHLIAGVVSDEMLLLTKGRAPVVPLAERMEIVRSIRCVDDVHAEVVPDKLDTWREVRFDVLFKGDDWKGTPKGDRLEASLTARDDSRRRLLDALLAEALKPSEADEQEAR